MRIAILLTGFYRSFKNTWPSILEIAKHLNSDIFICTWNKDSWSNNKEVFTKFIELENFPKNDLIKNIDIQDIDLYNKVRIPWRPNPRIDDVMITDPRAKEHGSFWANRLRDQWYLVQQGWKSMPTNYDLIFRSRLDIGFNNFKLIEPGENLVIPKDLGGWNYTDHMAYGNYAVMNKYATFYNNMQNLYDEFNIDPTHAVNFPEFYMKNVSPTYNIVINSFINYSIIR